MKNIKILVLSLSLVVVTGLFAGCGSNANNATETTKAATETTAQATTEAPAATEATQASKYKDGTYTAEAAEFEASSGWKDNVTLEIKDDKIVSAIWNGTHKDGGDDKVTASKNGKYGMKAIGKAQAEWHEEAAKVEAYLIEKQDPTDIKYTDADGHTDAISGATIKVSEFFKLAEEALNKAK